MDTDSTSREKGEPAMSLRRRLLVLALPLLLSACAPADTAGRSSPPVTASAAAAKTAASTAAASASIHAADPVRGRAAALRDAMTLAEKVGQLFFARCPGPAAGADAAAAYALGGYILFAGDFQGQTPATMKATLASYQAAAKIPLLFGVDEEGGTVVRISRYAAFRAAPFPSPQALFAAGGLDAVADDAVEKAVLLRSLGIHVNLAPVCDVSVDEGDFIHPRAFGRGARDTAAYVRRVVGTYCAHGLGCTLKHFPGYGPNADTHTTVARDTRPYTVFEQTDLVPFAAGIAAGAPSVLVSHTIVACLDDARPASLSPAVHTLLRETLGFDGVILTDDLAMDGIQRFTDGEEAAVQAVRAGNDLLIATDYAAQIPAVIRAVQAGDLPLATVDAAVTRVLSWKLRLGLLD